MKMIPSRYTEFIVRKKEEFQNYTIKDWMFHASFLQQLKIFYFDKGYEVVYNYIAQKKEHAAEQLFSM
jgi:hypothetical protein